MSWLQKYFPSFCSYFQCNSSDTTEPSEHPTSAENVPNTKEKSDSQPEPLKKGSSLSAAQLDY